MAFDQPAGICRQLYLWRDSGRVIFRANDCHDPIRAFERVLAIVSIQKLFE